MLRAQPAELKGITPEAHRLLAWRAVDGASVSLVELGRLQVVPLLTSSSCMLFMFAPDFRRRLSFCPTFGQVTQSRLQLQVGLSCAADRYAPSWSKPTINDFAFRQRRSSVRTTVQRELFVKYEILVAVQSDRFKILQIAFPFNHVPVSDWLDQIHSEYCGNNLKNLHKCQTTSETLFHE